MVDVVVAVVEARRGGGGTKGAYALAYAVVRRWEIESMESFQVATRESVLLCWYRRAVSGRAVRADRVRCWQQTLLVEGYEAL